jgi:hypothetical protein
MRDRSPRLTLHCGRGRLRLGEQRSVFSGSPGARASPVIRHYSFSAVPAMV